LVTTTAQLSTRFAVTFCLARFSCIMYYVHPRPYRAWSHLAPHPQHSILVPMVLNPYGCWPLVQNFPKKRAIHLQRHMDGACSASLSAIERDLLTPPP